MRREPQRLNRGRGGQAIRAVAKSLLVLVACWPYVAGAHIAGATSAADVLECGTQRRSHPAAEPSDRSIVTFAPRVDGIDEVAPGHGAGPALPHPALPADCDTDNSDARPRMNPGRLAQPAGDMTARIPWRQRFTRVHEAPGPQAHTQRPDSATAQHLPHPPVAPAGATPLTRFERAPRGPPAFADAPRS